MATQTYVAGTGGGSSTTITIDVSGETFSSGDQIVVFAGSDSSDSTDSSVSDDGSNSYTNLQSSSSTDPGLNLWVATLDGTETTVTVTTTTSGPNWSGAAVILRGYNSIVGGDVTTTLGGGGGMPDPPAGTAEASDDVLVIGALEDDVTDPITAPAGYTMLGFGNLGSSGSGCDIMAAIRATVSAGSENPSAFGGGGDDGWAAATLILTPTGGPEPEPSAMKVQHISDDVTNSGGTNTSFTEVASLSYAVELANNNRMTHAGAITGTSNGDDLAGGRVLTAVDTLTYYRESASNTTAANFRTSIWEYTGATGGPNEFVVLGRVAVTLNGSTRTYASTSGFTAPTDRNAVVPFITGIMNDDSGDGADSGTAIAWIDSSDRLNVEKGTISNNVTVYVTLVEFTGSNWTVLHGDSGDFSADTGTFDLYAASDFTGSVTAVTDQADSLILSGFRGDTAATGTNQAIADHWPLVTFTDNDTLGWEFDTNHDSDGTNRIVAHVIENSEWAVTRYTAANSGPLETTFDITSSGLTDLTQSLVVGHAYSSGTGTAYSRGWRNFYFNSLTEVGASASRTGNNMDYAVQVVDMTAMSAGSSGGTLLANAITTNNPTVGSSTLGQIFSIAGNNITTGQPAVGFTDLGQGFPLSGNNVSTGQPTLGSPEVVQEQALSLTGISTAQPTVGASEVAQDHSLSLLGIATGQPTIGESDLGQTFAVALVGITTGAPSVSAITLAEGGQFNLEPITTGIPAVGTSALVQEHDLALTGITSGQPNVDQSSLGQGYVFSPEAIAAGQPTVDDADFVQNHDFALTGITTGQPTVEDSTLFSGTVFFPVDIVTEAPVVPSINMAEDETFVGDSIVAGVPTLGTSGITQEHDLQGQSITTNRPVVSVAQATQVHIFVADNINSEPSVVGDSSATINSNLSSEAIVTDAPTVGDIQLLQTSILSGQSITTGQPTVEDCTAEVLFILVGESILTGIPVVTPIIIDGPTRRAVLITGNTANSVTLVEAYNQVSLAECDNFVVVGENDNRAELSNDRNYASLQQNFNRVA